MIGINDLFGFEESELKKNRIKIRFLVTNGEGIDPLEEYRLNPVRTANDWSLYYNQKKPFSIGDTVLTFVRTDPDLWLFIAAKEITGDDHRNHFIGKDIERFACFINRLVVRYKNHSQNLIRRYMNIMNDVAVQKILDHDYNGETFPGYFKVNISFRRLKYVIDNHIESWITNLSNMKAVYLITDTRFNRLYVGSATSDNGMLLGRWTTYIQTYHGGNVEFRKLKKEHIEKYFRYSILDVFSPNTQDDEILARESEWKDRLCTRTAGFNRN